MQFQLDKIGSDSPSSSFSIDQARLASYAAATNDPIASHSRGEVAPAIFSVVPAWEPLFVAVTDVTPQDALMFLVHGEQDMFFHAPLMPETSVVSHATPIGVEVKPSGTTLVVKAETTDESGQLLTTQFMTCFFRGIAGGEGGGASAPKHKLDGVLKEPGTIATFTQKIDADQTFRYAEASGDHNPIHLDNEFATSVGLPGIINHGLCTMAFVSWGIIENCADGDPGKLVRLAVRFSRPVIPGSEIQTQVWAKNGAFLKDAPPAADSGSAAEAMNDDGGPHQGAPENWAKNNANGSTSAELEALLAGTRSVVFETRSGDDLVIKDGIASLRD